MLGAASFALIPNEELSKKNNKLVKGSLQLKWGVYNSVYDEADLENEKMRGILVGEGEEGNFSMQSSRKTPRLVLRLQILSCARLGQADKFGLSDPFVIVKWLGQEVARTKVVDDCLNPVWKRESFCVTLPEFIDDKIIGGEKEKERDEEEKVEDNSNSGKISRNDVNLTLEVWDHDVVGLGSFLGQVEFLSDFFMHLPPAQRSYNLQRKAGMPVSEQNLVQGSMKLRMMLDGGDFGNLVNGVDHDGVKEMTITIIACYNLAMDKRYGPQNDPFVVVTFGDDEIGKTAV